MPHTLIAVDMDGTLLDGNGQLPPTFNEVAARCASAGFILTPASGRQLATLQEMFPHINTFIAENGTVVVYEGAIVGTSPIDPELVTMTLDAAETITAAHMVVLCTPTRAYANKEVRTDPALKEAQAQLSTYYKAVSFVPNIRSIVADGSLVIKIAIFCEAGSEEFIFPPLAAAIGPEKVVVSGRVWADIMAPGANKGTALKQLAEILDIPLSNTIAFGDFLNDVELLKAAGISIAMDNAHPELKKLADHIAPPNTEYGVITVLEGFLGHV